MSCGGFETEMWRGYEDTLMKLTKFMIKNNGEDTRSKINLIGFYSDNLKAAADLTEINRMLQACNITCNTVLTKTNFNGIKNAPNAALNVVLGGDGVKCARVMEEKFEIPYIILDYPYGLMKSQEFLEKICENLNKKVNFNFFKKEETRIKELLKNVHMYLQGIQNTPIAVIGEASRVTSLTYFLFHELGLNPKIVAITSSNYVIKKIIENIENFIGKIIVEPDEYVINKLIKNSDAELIFGSSFNKQLAYEMRVPLIRFSYPVIDEVSISNTPYAGFKGIPTIIEKILNSVLNIYYNKK